MGAASSYVPNRLNFRMPWDKRDWRKSLNEMNEGKFAEEYDISTRLAPKAHVVRNKLTGAISVAYKLLRENVPCKDKTTLTANVRRLQKLDHPNICYLAEGFDDDKYIYLIYQRAQGRCLFDQVSKHGLDTHQAAEVIHQAARAFKYGSDMGMSHGAVSAKNLFVDSKTHVTITDFGLAFLLKPSPLEGAHENEFNYLPPEALQSWLQAASENVDHWGNPRGYPAEGFAAEGSEVHRKELERREWWQHAADIWGLGVLFYALLSGRMPFIAKTKVSSLSGLAQSVCKGKVNLKPLAVSVEDTNSPIYSLIESMLTKDPAKRTNVDEVLAATSAIISSFGGPTKPKKLSIDVCKELGTLHEETHFKHLMMRLILLKMPARMLNELQDAFETMDTNHDGQITLHELKSGLAQHHQLKEIMCSDVDAIFKSIDVDHSGKVSLREFMAAALDTQAVLTSGMLWDTFKTLDSDHNGKLGPKELAIAVREIDGHMGSLEVRHMVQCVEQEVGNASLSFDHFKEMLCEEGQGQARRDAHKGADHTWCPCSVGAKGQGDTINAAAPGDDCSTPRPKRPWAYKSTTRQQTVGK
eukprot:gnl/TRDRNA2_/TRDRNA2_156852_c0_seq1.p1 gnl/TRDRNA2_/TRDRNA2_156852_c0~~gnl/TRDRNA2_/TRDRNA2_156852_c0_seq1.p1  ORF type:complete len:584 (+),score=91.67 gnl/TRDRNA2_/TRDRNA2_156852_c0_seq1:140-1891(+)